MERIEHAGIVERVRDGMVCVRITAHGACASCRAREACGLGESAEKLVEVFTPDAAAYGVGDRVLVGVNPRMGARAVMLAYVGALAVLVGMLALAVGVLGWSEGQSALFSLLGLGGYYGILRLLRRRIDDTIHFTITKQ